MRRKGPNPFAIGARVTVEDAGGRKQVREIRSGGGYLSQSDLRCLFGLGGVTGPATAEVRLGGRRWRFPGVPADGYTPSSWTTSTLSSGNASRLAFVLGVEKLKASGAHLITKNDFVHKTEHSIEFQVLFLQHLLPKDSFKIVPILCGNLQTTLPAYERKAYREKAGDFLRGVKGILDHSRDQTLIVAGVDFSHIGPKFGHEMPVYGGAE